MRLEANPDRSFTQRHDDEYHLFPATLGMFVDVNVDLDIDPKNICIEVSIIQQNGEDDDGSDVRAIPDGEWVGIIRVPISILQGRLAS